MRVGYDCRRWRAATGVRGKGNGDCPKKTIHGTDRKSQTVLANGGAGLMLPLSDAEPKRLVDETRGRLSTDTAVATPH